MGSLSDPRSIKLLMQNCFRRQEQGRADCSSGELETRYAAHRTPEGIMRRLAALLAPVIALSACYSGYTAASEGPRAEQGAWDDVDAPLAARLQQNPIGLGVDLNRPAYVAVFQILPGRGVGLFYPAYQVEESVYPAGFSTFPTHGARFFDSYFTAMPAVYSAGQPQFYFLVASRRPLRSISRFQHSDGALRSVLGLTAYTSLNYQRVMDDLVSAVVPPQRDEDWTTDVLAVWPSTTYGTYAYGEGMGYTRVYCGYGRYDVIPVELARWACSERDQDPRVAGVPGVPQPRGDTSAVRAPGRHRPEPGGTGTAGTGAQADNSRHWTVPSRRREPQDPDRRRITGGTGDDGRAASPSREGGARSSGDTRRMDSPRSEPRDDSPRTEAPRAEAPRSEPRAESPSPRAEAPATTRPASPPR